MRAFVVLVLTVVLAVSAVPSIAMGEDSGSISRDAKGPQPNRDHDPLGGPVTPRLYLLGQTTIFVVGITLLVVAAALGAFTLLTVRRAAPHPPR